MDEKTKKLIVETVEQAVIEKIKPLLEVQRKNWQKEGDKVPDWKHKALEFFQDLVHGKAMSEGTGSAGGYLVPDEFRAEVVRLIYNYGYARKFATKVPMSTDTMLVPALSSSVTVYWPSEANSITASDVTLSQVTLTAHKCAGLTVISNELLADAKVDVIDLLTQLFAEAMAKEEDKQAFAGSGSPFTGILNASGVNTVTMGSGDTTYAKVDFGDLIDATTAIDPEAKQGAAWFWHPTITGVLRKITDNNGQYIWSPPVGGNPGTVLGFPYYEIASMPSTADGSQANKPFIAFGNLKYLYFGDRATMEAYVAKEGSVGSTSLLQTDQSAIRLIERVAIAVAYADAFAVIKTAAS